VERPLRNEGEVTRLGAALKGHRGKGREVMGGERDSGEGGCSGDVVADMYHLHAQRIEGD
jgi:hypothetical protein